MTARTLRRRTRLGAALVLILGSILGLWLVNHITNAAKDHAQAQAQIAKTNLHHTNEVVKPLADQVIAICEAGGPAARALKDIGACPTARSVHDVVVKGPQGTAGSPGTPGRTGDQGPRGLQGPGPPPLQVSLAVASYCSTGVCAGHGPTAAQVAAAVTAYCNNRGQCQGPVGTAGPDGTQGTKGDPGTPGADGPPPTPEAVQSAVSDYCSNHNGCQGPKGDPGTNGRDAFPFTFTFVVPAAIPPAPDTTYTCTITDPADPVTCTAS